MGNNCCADNNHPDARDAPSLNGDKTLKQSLAKPISNEAEFFKNTPDVLDASPYQDDAMGTSSYGGNKLKQATPSFSNNQFSPAPVATGPVGANTEKTDFNGSKAITKEAPERETFHNNSQSGNQKGNELRSTSPAPQSIPEPIILQPKPAESNPQKTPEFNQPSTATTPAPNTATPVTTTPAPAAAAGPAPTYTYKAHNKMNTLNPVCDAKYSVLGPLPISKFPNEAAKYSTHLSTERGGCLRYEKDSSTYEGQVHEGYPHGFGRAIYNNGGILEGFFVKGVPNGPVRKIHPNGAMYEGIFKNNLPHGEGTYTDEKGKKYQCVDWQSGDMYGQTTVYAPNGIQVYKGEMKKNNKHGQGVSYDEATGSTMTGEFVDNKLVKGSLVKNNGYKYEGEFIKGIENGNGVMTTVDGRKVSGTFLNGKAEGQCTLTNEYGRQMRTLWKKGNIVSFG